MDNKSPLRIYFVRHTRVINPNGIIYGAEIELDWNDTPKLFKTARALPGPDCAFWISSDYPRAVQTAQALLNVIARSSCTETLGTQNGMYPDLTQAFCEQSWGAWVGQRKIALQEDSLFLEYMRDPVEIAPPEGESVRDMYNRVVEGLRKLTGIIRDQGKDEAVIICHGGVMRIIGLLNADQSLAVETFKAQRTPNFLDICIYNPPPATGSQYIAIPS